MPEQKRPIVSVKRDKKINNLNELLNMMPKEQYKKEKKEPKSEKINKEKNIIIEKEINSGFLKDRKKENDNVLNNLEKIEIDCSNSIFNFDGFMFNKNDLLNTSKINFKEEIVGDEDIKENEEIRNYFNKSLMEKIENPFYGDDKNDSQFEMLYDKDKSKFFNYDFFGDDNNE